CKLLRRRWPVAQSRPATESIAEVAKRSIARLWACGQGESGERQVGTLMGRGRQICPSTRTSIPLAPGVISAHPMRYSAMSQDQRKVLLYGGMGVVGLSGMLLQPPGPPSSSRERFYVAVFLCGNLVGSQVWHRLRAKRRGAAVIVKPMPPLAWWLTAA